MKKRKDLLINSILSPYEANILVSDKETSEYFEKVIKNSDVKLATNWITGELFALLNEKDLGITQSPNKCRKFIKIDKFN